MASIGSGVVAAIALMRTFGREKADDQDKRIDERIELQVGKSIAILQNDVKRILKKLDINGDD